MDKISWTQEQWNCRSHESFSALDRPCDDKFGIAAKFVLGHWDPNLASHWPGSLPFLSSDWWTRDDMNVSSGRNNQLMDGPWAGSWLTSLKTAKLVRMRNNDKWHWLWIRVTLINNPCSDHYCSQYSTAQNTNKRICLTVRMLQPCRKSTVVWLITTTSYIFAIFRVVPCSPHYLDNLSPEDQGVEAEKHEVPLLAPEHETARPVGVGQSRGLDKPRPGKLNTLYQMKILIKCLPVWLSYFLVTFEGLDVWEVWQLPMFPWFYVFQTWSFLPNFIRQKNTLDRKL